MKIAIFGLGYVGTVSAACLADLGHDVWGTDINPQKVDIINKGQSPIVEEGISELINKGVRLDRLNATMEIEELLTDTSLVLICVGTPNKEDGSHLLSSVEETCKTIAENMRLMAEFPVIVLRSTVLPGITEDLVLPILCSLSGLELSKQFGVGFNPEFLREGSSIYDFYNPPYTIIGADCERAFNKISEIYQKIDAPVYRAEIKVAEMIKMISNAYHALKVVFANEIGNICKAYEIDSHHVMDLFSKDTKLNISKAYLKPGYAFGGSCLPKDIKALLYMGNKVNIQLPVLSSILPSNEIQIKKSLDLIVKTGKRKIAVLGLSFKEGTDDMRYSAQIELVERLIGKGYEVKIYDENVSLSKLIGANKAYIEKEIPHISKLLCADIKTAIKDMEVIVIANKSSSFKKIFDYVDDEQEIIDLVRIIPEPIMLEDHIQYTGLGW